MGKKFKIVSVVLFFVLFCFSVTISAVANKQAVEKKVTHYKQKIEKFAGGDDEPQIGTTSHSTKPISQISRSASSISPGVVVGNTWYDYQQNGSMGRMIDWGNNPYSNTPGASIVYFGWTGLPDAALVDRHYAYSFYYADIDSLYASMVGPNSNEYSGFVNVQSKGDGGAFIGGHRSYGSGNQTQIDIIETGFDMGGTTRVPDSTAWYGASSQQSVIWPKFAYQEGSDTVTHVIAITSSTVGDPQAIYYFRRVGSIETSAWGGDSQGIWDYPPMIIDTVYTIAHDISASKTSDKLVLVWTANLNYDGSTQYPIGVCDTCSGTSPYDVQWDNDVYYQISNDLGLTWEPRVNVTKYRVGEAGFRAYTDLSVLIDTDDDVHILWNAVPWAADPSTIYLDTKARLFHYSEDVPFIRTVHSAEWDSPNCTPGAWNINIAKMSISECNGNFYALWTQFNDVPNGIDDDCAARVIQDGAANGELFVSVSADDGLTWDTPKNLTNSYTPNCNPNAGYDCESDNWPSMARFGRQNLASENWSSAVVVDPSGSYAGDYYLDVQYVNDRDAGGIIQNEGTWQISNINWFRMACVEPVFETGTFLITPDFIIPSDYLPPGTSENIALTLENLGATDVIYSVAIEEDIGTPGWLSVTGLSGTTPSGLNNIEVGNIQITNNTGIGAGYDLIGRIIITSNALTSLDTIPVSAHAIIEGSYPDTVQGYLSLVVSQTGNYGNTGDNRINLDFVTNGEECDSTASVYLYDASPIVLQINGADTTVASSIFDDSWLSPNGFRPQSASSKGSESTYNWYSTGIFSTPDSTVGFEQTFYAPTAVGANYIIKKLKVFSFDGAAHNGLRIGDAIDWDIPSDTGAWNTAGFDATRNLTYQIGTEFDKNDTLPDGSINPLGDDCVDDDTRFGGMAYLISLLNGAEYSYIPYSAYTARNDTFVFPNGNFIAGELWKNMDESGYSIEATVEDQHMVMCYDPSLNLGASDTLEYWISLVTVQSGTSIDIETAADNAKTFAGTLPFPDPGCCIGIRGNIDGGYDNGTNSSIDISDLVYLVAYMFQGGPAPPCLEEADCNGDGEIDIADLVCMVSFMFQFGLPPLPCPFKA